MLLEGACIGCGMAVQGASRDVELVSWPLCSLQEPCTERERELLNPLCYVHRRAGRVPVLLGGGRQPEHKLLCCYFCVICIAAPSWGKEGID